MLSIPKKRGRQPSPKTENYIYPPPLYVTMQVKGEASSGMGAVGGIVGLELTEEEERYYVSAVKTATVIVAEAMRKINGDERIPILITSSQDSESEPEFVVEMAKAVFEKIASPLFYLQSEKRQERKREVAKGLGVEFVGNVSVDVKEWRVASETEKGKSYLVRGEPSKDDYECTCPDFTFRGGRCKHIEAVRRKVLPSPSSFNLDLPLLPQQEEEILKQQEKEINEFMDY